MRVDSRRIKVLTCLAFSMLLVGDGHGAENSKQTLGFSSSKPSEGTSVAVDGGFLVSYKTLIPGSEVEYEMLPIPGGKVRLGSPSNEPGHKGDEAPQVEVEVGPMWVGKHEVTWQEYKLFMSMYNLFKKLESDGLRKINPERLVDAVTAPTPLYEPDHTFEFGDEPDLPAVTMTQLAAKHYTKWLSKLTGHQYRLPTEAEWEHACRAGCSQAYCFGHDIASLGEYAWFAGNSDSLPHKVGTKKPNAWGLHDMHGNVMEWTIEGFSEKGYASLANKPLPIANLDSIKWPESADMRVVRGGSFQDAPELLRSAARIGSSDMDWKSEDPNIPLSPWWYTSDPARGVGFRLFRAYQPLDAERVEKFYEIDHDDIRFDIDVRMQEGRGAYGLVDPRLADEIKKAADN